MTDEMAAAIATELNRIANYLEEKGDGFCENITDEISTPIYGLIEAIRVHDIINWKLNSSALISYDQIMDSYDKIRIRVREFYETSNYLNYRDKCRKEESQKEK